jgi:hypothetical protein
MNNKFFIKKGTSCKLCIFASDPPYAITTRDWILRRDTTFNLSSNIISPTDYIQNQQQYVKFSNSLIKLSLKGYSIFRPPTRSKYLLAVLDEYVNIIRT